MRLDGTKKTSALAGSISDPRIVIRHMIGKKVCIYLGFLLLLIKFILTHIRQDCQKKWSSIARFRLLKNKHHTRNQQTKTHLIKFQMYSSRVFFLSILACSPLQVKVHWTFLSRCLFVC